MLRSRSLSLLLFGRGICRYLLLPLLTFALALVCSTLQPERPTNVVGHLRAQGLRSPSRRTSQSPRRSIRCSLVTLIENAQELCRKLFQASASLLIHARDSLEH